MLHILTYLSCLFKMEFSWKPIDIPAQVYDYELGFSSTPGSMAPDIMAFESTNQHAHHRVTHGNVPDGTEFYIIIKTISKSNVEGLSVRIFKLQQYIQKSCNK